MSSSALILAAIAVVPAFCLVSGLYLSELRSVADLRPMLQVPPSRPEA